MASSADCDSSDGAEGRSSSWAGAQARDLRVPLCTLTAGPAGATEVELGTEPAAAQADTAAERPAYTPGKQAGSVSRQGSRIKQLGLQAAAGAALESKQQRLSRTPSGNAARSAWTPVRGAVGLPRSTSGVAPAGDIAGAAAGTVAGTAAGTPGRAATWRSVSMSSPATPGSKRAAAGGSITAPKGGTATPGGSRAAPTPPSIMRQAPSMPAPSLAAGAAAAAPVHGPPGGLGPLLLALAAAASPATSPARHPK